MSALRRPLHLNADARSLIVPPVADSASVVSFHRALPGFAATRLVCLDDAAKELGVKAVYLKDESARLGLPSFKILGASWGIHRAIVRKLGLDLDASFEAVRHAAAASGIVLFAATDGNHGRAVARMAALLSITAEIYVPASMHPTTTELIRQEGVAVVQCEGDYDAAVLAAQHTARQKGGVLVQDYDFEGGTDCDIPQWIVDGYSTMMSEIDEQLEGGRVDLVVVPVGVGSFAQAVVSHYKQPGRRTPTAVMSVEPDTAASLWKSLQRGTCVSERTSSTIMEGLNCGTLSRTAWPLLKVGIDASATVSDYESHVATVYLQEHGVQAGPCGSSGLAAVRRLTAADRTALALSSDSVIVLLCTEGTKLYDVPTSVAVDDAVSLTQTLVQINSANPAFGTEPGPGETAVARYVTAWLEHRDIESHWIEETPGRPSVVGVARGSGGGKSLMFNGHLDTVAVTGYDGDPLSGKIEGPKLYGRGAADMKAGIAASLVATANAKTAKLRGDVIFAGVADEEAESMGTENVLRAGWRADGAIVTEPTDLVMMTAHNGFVWLEVDIVGFAAHGSRADLGVDAIAKAGYFLVEVDRYAQRLKQAPDVAGSQPDTGSIHASLITGGVEASSYPAVCTVTLERRIVGGETAETVREEVVAILDRLAREVPDFKYECRATFHRPPFSLARDHPFALLAESIIDQSLGRPPAVGKALFWTDSALLAEKGIPTLIWGPIGAGLHAEEEWVDTASVENVSESLTALAREFCR